MFPSKTPKYQFQFLRCEDVKRLMIFRLITFGKNKRRTLNYLPTTMQIKVGFSFSEHDGLFVSNAAATILWLVT